MKTYPFSRLQKALLAVGSFSCLGLSSALAHADTEKDTQQLKTIKVSVQTIETTPTCLLSTQGKFIRIYSAKSC